MASVTGYTAAKMEELANANIVDGEIVGDDLILTRRDLSQINAGNVRGPQGETGPAPETLQAIGDVMILLRLVEMVFSGMEILGFHLKRPLVKPGPTRFRETSKFLLVRQISCPTSRFLFLQVRR
jgi:hypothetical protein